MKDPESGRYICKRPALGPHPACGKLVEKPRLYWCSQRCVDLWQEYTSPQIQRSLVKERDKGICWDCWCDCITLRQVIHATAVCAKGVVLGYQSLEKKLGGILGLDPHEVHALFTWARYAREQLAYTRGDQDHRGSRGRPIRRPTRGPIWAGADCDPRDEQRPDPELIDFAVRWDARLRGMARARLKRLTAELTERGFDITSRSSFWDMDHIHPVVEGGGLTGLENLRTLCQPCHKRRTRELAARRAAQRKAEKEGPALL